jgi:serine/threonine protein kinase
LGPYVVKETLGEGGFSKVKLGVHEKTGEKVALKILKNKVKMSKASVKQVEREISAMSKLKHPNILLLKEVDWDCPYKRKNGQETKIMLVVLELATGGELFEFLSFSGFFDEAVARTYFHQLIAGVECCHEQGVAHRDLKPENLLLSEDFLLKLADFGFSSIARSAEKMYTECGTPGYMAPEVYGSKGAEGYDGFSADIWACGVILFIMLAGFPPFQKPSNSDWWFNKLSTNRHSLFWAAHARSAYFSEQTKDFINKILNADAAKRMSIADMKKHPWWKGATVSNAQLVAELQRRKHTVDEVKERERERKRGEQGLEGDVMRGLGGESPEGEDALPLSPPKLTFRNYVFKDPTQRPAVEAEAMDFRPEEPMIRATPKPLPEATRYTRFDTTLAPAKAMERLGDVIVSNGGKMLEMKDEYKIKAIFGDVQFVIEIFAHPELKEAHVVDFRKKQGSGEAFREFYQDLRAQLPDVVLQPKAAGASPAPSPALSPAPSPSPVPVALAAPAAAPSAEEEAFLRDD